MQEMVEPDRTILIVSIIGLVVIWGSVAYHRFVQGGAPSTAEAASPAGAVAEPAGSESTAGEGSAQPSAGKSRRKGKGKRR